MGTYKEAGNSFRHFSNSFTLKGQYFHRLWKTVIVLRRHFIKGY